MGRLSIQRLFFYPYSIKADRGAGVVLYSPPPLLVPPPEPAPSRAKGQWIRTKNAPAQGEGTRVQVGESMVWGKYLLGSLAEGIVSVAPPFVYPPFSFPRPLSFFSLSWLDYPVWRRRTTFGVCGRL